jgi:metalloendopeptidase OMA1, mitochondrial
VRRRQFLPIPLILAALFAAYQYFGSEKIVNPETGRTARGALSLGQEQALGLQSYREVISQSDVVSSGPERDMVVRVARRLVEIVGPDTQDFDWQVSLVRGQQANAFCLPGGKIVVYTGILPYTRTEAALAAVMGHEMAHAIARHGSQRMLRTSVAQTLLAGAQFSITDMDPGQRQMVASCSHLAGSTRRRRMRWGSCTWRVRATTRMRRPRFGSGWSNLLADSRRSSLRRILPTQPGVSGSTN